MNLPGVDIIADLDRCADTKLPFEVEWTDDFLLSHVIEHLRAPDKALRRSPRVEIALFG
jgi:predicted SAM-dependent methyltransferase